MLTKQGDLIVRVIFDEVGPRQEVVDIVEEIASEDGLLHVQHTNRGAEATDVWVRNISPSIFGVDDIPASDSHALGFPLVASVCNSNRGLPQNIWGNGHLDSVKKQIQVPPIWRHRANFIRTPTAHAPVLTCPAPSPSATPTQQNRRALWTVHTPQPATAPVPRKTGRKDHELNSLSPKAFTNSGFDRGQWRKPEAANDFQAGELSVQLHDVRVDDSFSDVGVAAPRRIDQLIAAQ